jgi:hypothetical protein
MARSVFVFEPGSRLLVFEESLLHKRDLVQAICIPFSVERIRGECFADCATLSVVEIGVHSSVGPRSALTVVREPPEAFERDI